MQPTILLFDIDGTLISSDGAGRRAVERAFLIRTGRADACTSFSFAGMTDRAIARRGLEAVGARADEAAIDELLAAYLGFLEESVRVAENYRLHDGIVAALDHVAGRAGCAVGLGTGNLAAGARIKLGRVGIADRFAFGGFGSDAEDRTELLRIGAERGAALLGHAREACRVVVIGDTPRDVEAGHAIGAEVVAVATGPFTVEELRTYGPRFVYPDLAAAGALGALL